MNATRIALAFLLALGCNDTEEQERASKVRELREIVLDDAPLESDRPTLFGPSPPTLLEVVRTIDAARTDRQASGLFLRLGELGSAWARERDLLEAIAAFRAADKPVHCYFETIDNVGYAFAARACDRITVTPAGMLDTVGVAAHVFFARRLLDTIGVHADVISVGRFKGAAEPLTRDEMSPELRESLGALVDDLHADLIDALVTSRRMTRERAQAVLDDGPYDADRARAAGLVDDVAFDDEARTRARRAAHARRVVRVEFDTPSEPMDMDSILRAFSGEHPDARAEGPRLALVHLDGNIIDAEESGTGGGRSGPFVRHMRRLTRDPNVRAVVLRIDSPGGSALASDRMWQAVRRCAAHKPVIVSLGDVAASGGYYVASAGTFIFAHPTSTIGSIGVVGGKVDLSEVMSRVGVSAEVIRRGRNAGWSSPTRGFSETERAVLLRAMRSTYARFVDRVAVSRSMNRAAVERVAEGRVWSGRRGLEHGLVDRIGGLRSAIALARERGRLEHDAPIDEWPRKRGVLELIAELFGGGDRDERTTQALLELARAAGPFAGAAELAYALSDREHVLVTLPIVFEIR